MTADEQALLNAILAAPEDDLPRLVYADWLEERGRAERAEFIRVQCELAKVLNDPDRKRERNRWRERSNKLSKRHGRAWLAELPQLPMVQWAQFVRGFATRAVIRPNSAQLDWVDELFQILPLTELEFRVKRTDVLTALLARPALRRLRALRLSRVPWSSIESGRVENNARLFTNFAWPAQLQYLVIRGGFIGDQVAEALATIPPDRYFPVLDLCECWLLDNARSILAERFGDRVLM